jgi:hypothetical protein
VAQTADNSLEQRIKALEDAVRSLTTSAAVGGTSVSASDASELDVIGTANVSTITAWNYAGPYVDLMVTGGRIMVDLAAALQANGLNTSLYMAYEVRGPAIDQPSLATAPQLQAPDRSRSLSLQDDGSAQGTMGSISTFDLVPGLAVGWYRIRAAYALGFTSQTGTPVGIATNRRIAVTRY